MLELCDIELGFSAVPLFSGLNLTIAPGEFCLLTAPSGAGKSSLLRWMAGLKTPGLRASGQVRLGGRIVSDLPAERRELGLLFQTPLLLSLIHI